MCNSNVAIQISLGISDVLCIKNKKPTPTISAMNILSCLKFKTEVWRCNSDSWTQTKENTTLLLQENINFFNTNGSMYLDNFPYTVNKGEFPLCKEFKSEVDMEGKKVEIEYINQNTKEGYEKIKNYIFFNGPAFAFFDSKYIY